MSNNHVPSTTDLFNQPLNEESVKSIKAAVNSVAKAAKLSKSQKEKLLKYELDNPSEWWDYSKGQIPTDPDNLHDMFVQSFYNSVNDVFSGRVPVDPRVDAALLYARFLSMNHDIHVRLY
jgi:hypothetical protein